MPMPLPQLPASAMTARLNSTFKRDSAGAETTVNPLQHISTGHPPAQGQAAASMSGWRTLVDDHAQCRDVRAQRLDGPARVICSSPSRPSQRLSKEFLQLVAALEYSYTRLLHIALCRLGAYMHAADRLAWVYPQYLPQPRYTACSASKGTHPGTTACDPRGPQTLAAHCRGPR